MPLRAVAGLRYTPRLTANGRCQPHRPLVEDGQDRGLLARSLRVVSACHDCAAGTTPYAALVAALFHAAAPEVALGQ